MQIIAKIIQHEMLFTYEYTWALDMETHMVKGSTLVMRNGVSYQGATWERYHEPCHFLDMLGFYNRTGRLIMLEVF
jgi:hypothetical protein